MGEEKKMAYVMQRFRENHYRVTSQRKVLLKIIMSGNYSSCKEIYVAAKQADRSIGIATVYRTVQLLEDLGLVKKEMVLQLQEQELELSKIS